MTATSTSLDRARTDLFMEKVLGMITGGSLAMMISIGHRTGLWDALASLPASTSQQVADVVKLQERYVREWLKAMAVARVLDYDAKAQTFKLPAEHAACLTRAATPGNLAATAQWISVLASVEDRVIDAFQNGGGVHYDSFHRFHEVMAAESAQTTVSALQEHILPLVPELRQQLQTGIKVLDVGCGSGWAVCDLAAAFPRSQFTGYDLCEDAIAAATARAKERDLRNVTFEVHDVSDLGPADQFDFITAFDAIHDQRDPAGVLKQIHKVLKPTGTFLMQDISASSHVEQNMDHPMGAFFYTISTMHCMTVSLAQGGAGLGTCWGRELAQDMLKDAGFRSVKIHQLPHDIQNDYYVIRP